MKKFAYLCRRKQTTIPTCQRKGKQQLEEELKVTNAENKRLQEALEAENDYAKAVYMMGDCFYNGIWVEIEEDEALNYFKIVGKLGCREAEESIHYILLSHVTPSYDDVPV